MDVLNVQLHLEQFPLREIQTLAEWLLHTEPMRKFPHQNGSERLRHTFAINPTPGTTEREPPTFTKEGTVWTTHLVSYLLTFPPKEWAPKLASSESQQGLNSWVSGDKEAVLNKCASTCHGYTRGLSAEEASKIAHPPVFPWKGFGYRLYKLLPEEYGFYLAYIKVDCDFHQRLKELEGTSVFALWFTLTIKPSVPGRSLLTYLAPQLLWLLCIRRVFQSPSSDSQQGMCSWVPQDYSKQRSF